MPQMIFFTWPSDGPYTGVFPIDLAVRGRQADFNSFHLGYLLSQIPASCPVCLIGHSHGTRVILATMQLAAGGTVEGFGFPYSMGNGRRYRLILAAGAIDHNWLNPGQPYDRALYPIECLLNFRNRKDLPLTFFPLTRPFARRAIARSGITNHDLQHLGYNAAKIHEADVTQMVGHSHYWPEYYRHPAVLRAMLPYMLFY
jgi:esterase/lipase superfamily enzyme